MGDKVRVGILETNGVEEEELCERNLDASIVALDPAVSGYDDVQTWIENSGSTDHHSGWREIVSGQLETVVARKEMRVRGFIKNFGTLQVFGTLVVD